MFNKPPEWYRTNELYWAKDKKVENMTEKEIKTLMCGRSRGNVEICHECAGKCRLGKEMIRRTQNGKDKA